MRHPSRGIADAQQLKVAGHLLRPRLRSAGFHAPPIVGWQMRRTCKVRRISYGLGLWHSHVAQLRPQFRSAGFHAPPIERCDRCPAALSCWASPAALACGTATLPKLRPRLRSGRVLCAASLIFKVFYTVAVQPQANFIFTGEVKRSNPSLR